MIEFYIVKRENTEENISRPNCKISLDEYQAAIDAGLDFTWFEDTQHGRDILEKHSFTLKRRAYFNYIYNDPLGYIQLLWSKRGYIQLVIEGKVINDTALIKLVEFSNLMDSCIWRLKPLEKIENLKEDV